MLLVTALFLSAPALRAADDFPPITPEEAALSAETLGTKEPAIILSRQGAFYMQDFGKQMTDSRLVVQVRLKILTDEGKEYGEIALPHSSANRLRELRGRTVLPDGRILPLQTTHRQEASRKDPFFITVAAFDGVEVGAILDYEYTVRFSSYMYLEPWYFQDRIPTRHSEIAFYVPGHIGVKPWARESVPGSMKFEVNQQVGGIRELRAWADNLPAIPAEPFTYPFADLASQYLLLPTQYVIQTVPVDLLTSWKQIGEIFERHWGELRRGKAKSKGRDLAAGQSSPRAKAEAIYRFVRDEIRLESLGDPDASIDKVLAAGRGDEGDQALLLQAMLDGAKLDAEIVWASTRSNGAPDMNTPNPGWFDTNLVHLELDGQPVYLLPTDRGLAFGQLPPDLEGTQALVFQRKDPQVVTLPATPFTDHRRNARIDLALDDEGKLSGSGILELTGNQAWRYLLWKDTPEATTEAWRDWLQERFSQYQVSDVKVLEQVAERRIELRWQLQQSAEEALGDEASLQPSRPLGPIHQPLPVPPESRRTPVLLDFPYRDDVQLTLTWPAGWELDLRPEDQAKTIDNLGSTMTRVTVDGDQRRLIYSREFQIERREHHGRAAYTALRDLFAAVEQHDAQPIVLVRR